MSLRGRMKVSFFIGACLCVSGAVGSYFEGPEALTAVFFGLFPLMGGFRLRSRVKHEEVAAKAPMSWD
jgi:hypothetical protein